MGQLIVLVCGDEKERQQQIDWSLYPELKDVVVQRDDHWRRQTWTNIAKIIKITTYNILERPEEEHWRVKMALVRLSIAVLESCSCVGSSSTDLIGWLIVLCSDNEATVREEARRCVNLVAKMRFNVPVVCPSDGDKQTGTSVEHSGSLLLSTVVRDNLDTVIGCLGELCGTPSDDIKCKKLQQLDGYLAIHALEHLPPPSCVQVNRIISHLISLCQLDHNSLDLLDHIYVTDISVKNHCEFFTKQFIAFHNENVYRMVASILSRLADIVMDIGSLVEMLHSLAENDTSQGSDGDSSATNRTTTAAVILLTKLVVTAVTSNDNISMENKITLCKTILITYFDADTMGLATGDNNNHNRGSAHTAGNFWTDPIAAIELKKESSTKAMIACSANHTPTVLKQNTLIIAMVMELCAVCCLCIQQCPVNDTIDSWLMRTCLFEVMNKSQQSPHLICHVASQCLHFFTIVHPKYRRLLPVLIELNADYIMDSIARRLRSAAIMLRTRNTDDNIVGKADAACRCLITLCRNAGDGITPFLQTILHQLLYCIDETSSVDNRLFMPVLQEIVQAISRWRQTVLSPTMAIEDTRSPHRDKISPIAIVRQFILDRNDILVSAGLRKSLNEVPIEQLEDANSDESYYADNKDNCEPEKSEPLPTTVVIQNIAERCINLMSDPNGQVRLACLDILNESVYALQKEENVLRVMVHQLWAPLQHRLWDKEYPVIIRAFTLVNTISQLCADFLYAKIKDGFVFKLCLLLERCATISASPTATMKYTGLYHLQMNLSRFLSQLVTRTELHGQDLEQVVDAFLVYLDDRQPLELVSVCETSLKLIFVNDPGLVWYKLAQIVSSNCNEEEGYGHIFGHTARAYDSHYTNNTRKLLLEFNLSHK